MQGSTKILLLIGVVAILGLFAFVTLGPGPQDSYSTDTDIAEEIGVPPVEQVEPGEQLVSATPGEIPRETSLPPIDPSSGKGRISGRISVSTRLIDKISSYTIVVREDVNTNGRKETDPPPFFRHQTFPAKLFRSPYFDLEDIPFSKHPYKVTVVAKGVNGSSQHNYINAESPTGSKGDVQLSLTPGAYFAIRLRDQRHNPRTHLPVRMSPVGESLVERETQIGESDRNGHVLFEDVVLGDYEIRVGPLTAPLAPPEKVTVYHALPMFDPNGRPKTQGAIIMVPDGHHVTVEIHSSYGYPVENAELKAWQLEIQRYYDFKGVTDHAGRFVFDNVPYGVYQLSVISKTNGVKDLKFKVEKDKPAPIVKVNMSR